MATSRRHHDFLNRARILAAITVAVFASPLVAHAGSILDATLQVTPRQASDAEAFNVRGITSCSNSVVMMVFTNYLGEDDFAQYRPTFRSRADGRFDYTGTFDVPDQVRPGSAYLYTDQGCGDPDASPSPHVPVTISKAHGRLAFTQATAAASSVVRLSGDQCYGPAGARVSIRFSGLRRDAVSAPLKGSSYSVEVRLPSRGGTLTAVTDEQDCLGSTQARASLAVTSPATLTPATSSSRSGMPHARTSTPRASPSSSPSGSIGPAEPGRTGWSGFSKVILTLGLIGAATAVVVAASRGRRRR